jgi:hypothetical protein
MAPNTGPAVTTIGGPQPLDIAASQVRTWTWSVQSPKTRCRITGRVLGLAGGEKDVDVLIMTEDDYLNWINHHPAKVYFESGKRTAIPIDVRIDGEGRYVLVVSNVFSAFSPKTVEIQNMRVSCTE